MRLSPFSATVAVFCDSLTFLRQCGQGIRASSGCRHRLVPFLDSIPVERLSCSGHCSLSLGIFCRLLPSSMYSSAHASPISGVVAGPQFPRLNFSLSENYLLVGKFSLKSHGQKENFHPQIQNTWLDWEEQSCIWVHIEVQLFQTDVQYCMSKFQNIFIVIPRTETRTTLLFFSPSLYTHIYRTTTTTTSWYRPVHCSLRQQQNFWALQHPSNVWLRLTRARFNVSHAPLVSRSKAQSKTGLWQFSTHKIWKFTVKILATFYY